MYFFHGKAHIFCMGTDRQAGMSYCERRLANFPMKLVTHYSLTHGFLDFRLDFWISQWISGFHSGFLDFSLDFWISVWSSADGVRDFFRDGPLASATTRLKVTQNQEGPTQRR